MSCEKCRNFGGTSANYEYFGINISGHKELYRCKNCDQFLEIVAEARSPYFLTFERAKENFPDVRKELDNFVPRT